MEIPAGKKYEQPDAGIFIGTIIDVVFLPNYVPKKQNPAFPKPPQDRLQIVWILDKVDKDGRPFRITEQPPFKMVNGTKKSRLYEIFEGVFQGAIPVPYESEDLMGKSNRLFLAKDGEYTNIKGFMPLSPGDVAPKAPSDFVRSKDRKAGQTQVTQQAAKPVTVPAAEEDVQF